MYFNFIHANGIHAITSQCVCFFSKDLFLRLLEKVIEYTCTILFMFECARKAETHLIVLHVGS